MPEPSSGSSPPREGLADPTDERSNCGVGVVVDLDGGASRDVVQRGVDLLRNLEHRGTTGAEADTGDGAGILLQRPDAFLDAVTPVDLPETYAVGSVFLPRDGTAAERVTAAFEGALAEHGLEVFHWRTVPTVNDSLGETALQSEPAVRQPFVRPADGMDAAAFDRALYVGRRAAEKRVDDLEVPGGERFYVASLDRKTLVYKGLLTAEQLPEYYPDLTDERLRSTLVLVHARFSTNTLGAWHLAHPYRNVAHNGEINTIQGNVNWMRARETDLEHPALDVETITPVIDDPNQSDTASLDNALELLMEGGRSLPHALRMLVPEAFREDDLMATERREWYDYHASLVEPWDGPALVCGTDGDRVAAVLDRNGLRPCRYDVTTDDTLIMASEVGALDVDPSEVRERGRLRPGQLFVADPDEGRVVPDDEVFDELTDPKYGEWVSDHQRHVDDYADEGAGTRDEVDPLRAHQAAFGYTRDQLDHLLEPMMEDGKDPVGSMGDDT
ncbi:MAG: glutamate synthase central domain-containing protein, partial [Haloferacaceae archaeon]